MFTAEILLLSVIFHQKFDVRRWINIRKYGSPSISVIRHKIPPIYGPQSLKFHLFKYFSWIRTRCHGSRTIIGQVIGQLKKTNTKRKCTDTLCVSRISTMTSEKRISYLQRQFYQCLSNSTFPMGRINSKWMNEEYWFHALILFEEIIWMP